MNSLPAGDRGAGGGMNQTFQNSAQVLSIGIFFTLMILGPRGDAPDHASTPGSQAHGVAHATAGPGRRTCRRSRSCSPPSSATTRSSTCSARARFTPSRRTTSAALTGPSFFPHLISAPFRDGLHAAFAFAIVACLVAAAASLMRGGPAGGTSEPGAGAGHRPGAAGRELPPCRPSTSSCTAPVPNGTTGAPIEGQSGWEAHAEFMDDLVEQGFIVLGGPLFDGSASST